MDHIKFHAQPFIHANVCDTLLNLQHTHLDCDLIKIYQPPLIKAPLRTESTPSSEPLLRDAFLSFSIRCASLFFRIKLTVVSYFNSERCSNVMAVSKVFSHFCKTATLQPWNLWIESNACLIMCTLFRRKRSHHGYGADRSPAPGGIRLHCPWVSYLIKHNCFRKKISCINKQSKK